LGVTLVTAVVIVAGVGAARACCQSPSPDHAPASKLSEAEKARRLAERDRYYQEAARLAQAGKLDEAVTAYEKKLAIEREVLGEFHEDVIGSLVYLAYLREYGEDWAAARKALEEVLAIRERQAELEDWQVADARRALADLDRRAAMTPAQRRRLQEAHRLHQLWAPPYRQRKYEEGIVACRTAMQIRGELLGKDHPDYAESLNDVALYYHTTGDFARAEQFYREALAVLNKTLGADHPHHAGTLNSLAALYVEIGDFARAEPILREALAIKKKVVGANHSYFAASLNNLALLYVYMGDYARAEPMLREALDITKKTLSPDHPYHAISLNSLAGLYRAMGDHARAEPMLREALEIRKKAVGTDHLSYAASLNNLAGLYDANGDHPRAVPMLREALAITKNAVGANHPAYASVLGNLGWIYRKMGDYARAEPMLREAVEVTKKAVGEYHPDYAESLIRLADLYGNIGDRARAKPICREALAIASRFTHETASVLGDRQRLRLHQQQRTALDVYITVSSSAVPRPPDLYDHVVDWKGAAEAGLADERLARDQTELAPSLARLALVRGQLANLAFRPPAGQAETWRQQVDRLREAKEDLEADLTRRSAGYRAEKQGEHLGSVPMSSALPADVGLVDFLQYTHYGPLEAGTGRPRGKWQMLAFVVRRGRPVVLVPLGEARAIDESVRSWRRAQSAHQADALQAAAAELGRRVWDPLRPHLGDARAVLIAPDGALSFFPFAALPGSKPRSYLIEDLAVSYIASSRHAGEVLADPKGPAGRGLLAVGDVDFQAEPGQPSPSGRPPTLTPQIAQRGGFEPLPGTGPEARRARELFEAAFAAQPAELLTRAEPTEAAIKRRLDGGHWRVVHLGTHGFFESPARISALRAAAGRENTLALELKATKAGDSDPDFALTPLLRSGVVLAGGGREPDAGPSVSSIEATMREDGIMTAEEVQALDLRGTELVVLSACETGLGALEYGQGVMGLQRAFQSAGARAVVASLWKVDDAATSVLMEQFYTNLWVKKMAKLEALRQAQITVLKNPGLVTARQAELAKRGIGEKAEKLPAGGKASASGGDEPRSDPSLWAAFVMSGDWR
jgi:CHAT domain-containing protein/Tfp pilus assembly protein PilF